MEFEGRYETILTCHFWTLRTPACMISEGIVGSMEARRVVIAYSYVLIFNPNGNPNPNRNPKF